VRAIGLVLLVFCAAACGEDAGYTSAANNGEEKSLLVGSWLSEEGAQTVTLGIDEALHMVATFDDGETTTTQEFDLAEQAGDLILRDRARVSEDLVEERRGVQTYFVDFEIFLPLALRKTDDTEFATGVYLSRDDQQVELDGELVLKGRTEVVLMLAADGTWTRTSTAWRYFEYDDDDAVQFLDPPLEVETITTGTWEEPGARQLRLVESAGAYDVTVPLRNGHLPSDDIFWRQPN
jgi:hypothetical protein